MTSDKQNVHSLHIETNDLSLDRLQELIVKSVTDVGSSVQNDSHDVSILSIVLIYDS